MFGSKMRSYSSKTEVNFALVSCESKLSGSRPMFSECFVLAGCTGGLGDGETGGCTLSLWVSSVQMACTRQKSLFRLRKWRSGVNSGVDESCFLWRHCQWLRALGGVNTLCPSMVTGESVCGRHGYLGVIRCCQCHWLIHLPRSAPRFRGSSNMSEICLALAIYCSARKLHSLRKCPLSGLLPCLHSG